jgi:dCTP deaminase
MILSADAIREELGQNIVIDPFQEQHLNPNSYNLTLHEEMLVYEEVVLDMRTPNRTRRIIIPDEGLVLKPDQIYLGRTAERIETHNFVPMVQGRSSVARLGLFVDASTGFGDAGFCGYWTLELYAVQPIRIYAGVPICQVYYHRIDGDVREYDSKKYQHNTDIQPSLLYRELNPAADEEMVRQRQFQFEL